MRWGYGDMGAPKARGRGTKRSDLTRLRRGAVGPLAQLRLARTLKPFCLSGGALSGTPRISGDRCSVGVQMAPRLVQQAVAELSWQAGCAPVPL